METATQEVEELGCPRCLKLSNLCLCADFARITNRIPVLILQHPQEPDVSISTASLASGLFENSKLKIGLSWKNLAHAWGAEVSQRNWMVLHLGSSKPSDESKKRSLFLVDKKGVALPARDQRLDAVEGIVVLDGTWSQAKTLWWRNAWLLKLQRGVATPQFKTVYNQIRREPRRECISTLESVALALSEVERNPRYSTAAQDLLSAFVKRVKR